ncbi:MAG: hypothetical protein ACFBSG_09190 [Leptolyngbyaceae cyanobacterium]
MPLFTRCVRLVVMGIGLIVLLLGTLSCSQTTPEDLPKLRSVTEQLDQQDKTIKPAAPLKPQSVPNRGLSIPASQTASSQDDLERLSDQASQTAAEVEADLKASIQTETQEVQAFIEDEKAAFQKTLETLNDRAAEALDDELERAENTFDAGTGSAQPELFSPDTLDN